MDESRRSLIKKAAAGAGVVWATPIITSLATPALAGTPAPTTTLPTPCPPLDRCIVPGCGCYETTGRKPVRAAFDHFDEPCPCPPGWFCYGGICFPDFCFSDSECPPGQICVIVECAELGHCARPCSN